MSNLRAASNEGDKHSGICKEEAVAKTAGFVDFSRIAVSLLKTLNPFNKEIIATSLPQPPVVEPVHSSPAQSPAQSVRVSPPPPHPVPKPTITKEITRSKEQGATQYSKRVLQIVKGDTLWGLSRKYGVSIDAIREANSLTGDTIYAGKKLVIP